MARRRKSKIQPAVQTLTFSYSVGAGQATNFIDISQCASIVNRRFYRQGLNWAVSGIKFLTSGGTGQLQICKLPNTWVMSNAWEKCFRAWKKQQDEALESGDQQSVKAKFNDFKIYADGDHQRDGFAANLLPVSCGPISAAPGEWEVSQILIPNFGAVGNNIEPAPIAVGDFDLTADNTYFSLIQAYANSRSVPQSPDPAVTPGVATSAENVFVQMFDVGDDSALVIDNVVGKNDELPYPQMDYPGGGNQLESLEIHSSEFVTATTIGGTTRMKGGNFPCGLLAVNAGFDDTTNIYIEIDLVPGTHRGYLCEPMTEM